MKILRNTNKANATTNQTINGIPNQIVAIRTATIITIEVANLSIHLSIYLGSTILLIELKWIIYTL